MRKMLVRFLPLLFAAAITAGCAEPARTSAMIADVQPNSVLADNSPIRQNLRIAEIAGGKETDPVWTSQVSGPSFREALSLSLKQHTILGDDNAPLGLKANLITLDQPLGGFDMTVTSTVLYQITNASGERIFDETITAPFTADFSSAFAGVERLKLANEGSIRNNIRRFIDLLIQQSQANPEKFGPALTSGLRLKLG